MSRHTIVQRGDHSELTCCECGDAWPVSGEPLVEAKAFACPSCGRMAVVEGSQAQQDADRQRRRELARRRRQRELRCLELCPMGC